MQKVFIWMATACVKLFKQRIKIDFYCISCFSDIYGLVTKENVYEKKYSIPQKRPRK